MPPDRICGFLLMIIPKLRTHRLDCILKLNGILKTLSYSHFPLYWIVIRTLSFPFKTLSYLVGKAPMMTGGGCFSSFVIVICDLRNASRDCNDDGKLELVT